MQLSVRVYLVDDHSVVRHGTSLLLQKAFEGIIISHADNFEDSHKYNSLNNTPNFTTKLGCKDLPHRFN